MRNRLNILFIEDNPIDVQLEQRELTRDGLEFAARVAVNETDLRLKLAGFVPDVVLCDYNVPGFSGEYALKTVRDLQPSTPILVVSGSIIEDAAIDCLKFGATDYILKSNLRRLGPAVRRAVAETRQRKEFEDRIDQLAHYDTLTGLPNLAQMNQRVSHAIERARNAGKLVAVTVLNLDHFRFVDDAFGRKLGDDVLKDISALLQAETRQEDCVARICSDEFLVALSDLGGALRAGTLVQDLLGTIARPRQIGGRDVNITASAGVALYPNHGADFETLLSKATTALHSAKVLSPGRMQFHSDHAARSEQQRWQLEVGLRNAIERQELSLVYQPQYEISTGRFCGIEALARWFRTAGGTVAPSVFIPLAERTGLIDALGTWALRTGCEIAAEWPPVHILAPLCINVSGQQIREEFTADIARALELSGLSADQLELEITESVLVGNDRAIECLSQWKSMGVRIAVDDFGTGYSSLSYLSKLPIDRLKIDRSFVRDVTEGSRESTILKALISLGRDLGFTVIAEGVETEEQLGLLDELGCHQAQGFLMSPPASAQEVCALMDRRWGLRSPARITSKARKCRALVSELDSQPP